MASDAIGYVSFTYEEYESHVVITAVYAEPLTIRQQDFMVWSLERFGKGVLFNWPLVFELGYRAIDN